MVRPRNEGKGSRKKRETPIWEQEEFESRTQIKNAANQVTDMGEALTKLSVEAIKKLKLPTQLEDALILLKDMPKGPAEKRQRLFVGRLLRKDEDTLALVRQKIEDLENKSRAQNAHFHRLEKLRDRLIEKGDELIQEMVEDYPAIDRSTLRTLIRNAQKEAEEQKPPKAYREIFQLLKDAIPAPL